MLLSFGYLFKLVMFKVIDKKKASWPKIFTSNRV